MWLNILSYSYYNYRSGCLYYPFNLLSYQLMIYPINFVAKYEHKEKGCGFFYLNVMINWFWLSCA